jgi:hypothetical protein
MQPAQWLTRVAGSRTLAADARSVGRAHTIMKSEIGCRRWRATKALSRLCASVVLGETLVFTTLGPLTLSLFFASYLLPAHADTISVFGTPGTPGVDSTATTPATDGGPGGDATATAGPNSDPSNTASATGGAGGAGGNNNVGLLPAGKGGPGGQAAATALTNTADSAGNGFATATGTGGAGGRGGAGFGVSPGVGGAGGNATSNAVVINVPNATVSSTANGGAGGGEPVEQSSAHPVAMEVARTPKQAVSPNSRPRSLPPQ